VRSDPDTSIVLTLYKSGQLSSCEVELIEGHTSLCGDCDGDGLSGVVSSTSRSFSILTSHFPARMASISEATELQQKDKRQIVRLQDENELEPGLFSKNKLLQLEHSSLIHPLG
jgi:hypothetical protein